jgi:hypothetical protein
MIESICYFLHIYSIFADNLPINRRKLWMCFIKVSIIWETLKTLVSILFIPYEFTIQTFHLFLICLSCQSFLDYTQFFELCYFLFNFLLLYFIFLVGNNLEFAFVSIQFIFFSDFKQNSIVCLHTLYPCEPQRSTCESHQLFNLNSESNYY